MLRVRLMNDDLTRGKYLRAAKVEVTQVSSASATIAVTVSERVAGRMDSPQLVSVEVAGAQIRTNLFMLDEDDSDDADQTKMVTLRGVDYVTWMLQRTLLHWSASAKNGERQWVQFPSGSTGSATPGYTLNGMLVESKNRGWGANVTWDFTGLKDSAGVAWSLAGDDLWWSAWTLLTPLSKVIEMLAEQGFCEWWSEGGKLRLFRPGTADDHTSIVLGGAGFKSRPVKSSFKNVITNFTVVPEKARNWLYLPNPGASTRFGRLEASISQSGVADHVTATRLAQPALTAARAAQQQFSFDWDLVEGMPVPGVDFNIGDLVTTNTRAGRAVQRVVGIQFTRESSSTSVRAITGDRLLTDALKRARKSASAVIGDIIGGSGNGLPTSKGPTFPVPAAPTGLHVETDASQWGADGSAVTSVTLAWDAVSQAEDGSGVDVSAYEVGIRTDGQRGVVATTDALEWTATGWPVGVTVQVSVRAVAPNGDRGAWSAEIPVTPTDPARPVKVTGLTVTSQQGSWRADGTAQTAVSLAWDAVSVDTGGHVIPVTYEVQSRLPVQSDANTDQTTVTITGWEPGKTRYVKVRAVSGNGKGDWSDELAVPVAVPASIVPKPPANLQLVVNIGSWGEGGLAIGAVYVQWDRVTESVDGAPVTIVEYEALDVSSYERLQVFDIDPADLPYALGVFPSKSMAQVAVRALTSTGVWSDFAVLDPPVEVASPTLSVISPSALVTSTGLGGASGRWDGKLAGGVDASTVAGFASVQVETATAAAGPWSPAGSRLARAGTVSVQSQTGATVYFRATAYDTLGRAMGTSTVSSVVVQGVSLDDIPGLEGDLDDIRFTADGKNRVYMSATEPVGDTPTVVKRRNAALNPQQVASGSDREAQPRYSWSRSWTTGIMDHPLGLDTALRVTLTAASQTGAGRGFDWYGNADTAPASSGVWLSAVEVTPGQTMHATVWARTNRNGLPFAFGVRFFDHVTLTWKSTLAYSPVVVSIANGWAMLELSAVVPAGATRATFRGVSNRDSVAFVQNDWMEQTGIMIGPGTYLDGRTAPKPGLGYKWEGTPDASASVEVESAFAPGDLWLQLDPTGASIISILVWNGTAWAPQVLYADSIIAAESITSQLVRAGAIEVNHVSPSFGDSLNLQGNGSINLLAGRADAAAEQLTSQQAALDQQSAQLAAAQAAADAAQAG
ncbi:MAG TPA: fibronectin type III domain-containing protein, partial [Microbacterium sp.]|nr:fibronectin type III domain-containing protein [Microbacterium sp.]